MRVALTAGCLALAVLGLGGCKKKTTPATTPATVPASPSGGGNTSFVPGGGAIQNVRQAAKRTVTVNDLYNLAGFIQFDHTTKGQMPSKSDVMATLAKEMPSLKAAVDDGTIILCWTSAYEGLWAYEIDADTKGGLALVSGVASPHSAADIKRLLGR